MMFQEHGPLRKGIMKDERYKTECAQNVTIPATEPDLELQNVGDEA